jgi:hypothetical protein
MEIQKPEDANIELDSQIKRHLETLTPEQIEYVEDIFSIFRAKIEAQRIEIERQNSDMTRVKADLANANLRQLEYALRAITERKKNL